MFHIAKYLILLATKAVSIDLNLASATIPSSLHSTTLSTVLSSYTNEIDLTRFDQSNLSYFGTSDLNNFDNDNGYDNEFDEDFGFGVQDNDKEDGDENAKETENGFFLISSGLSKEHSQFQYPYFSKISRKIYYNINPEYLPWKINEDLIGRNDENGAGMAAAGLCCSPKYGSYGKKGMRLYSYKIFDKFGRGDPMAFVRAMRAIASKIKSHKLKKVTILLSPPSFINGYTNSRESMYGPFFGKFRFQKRLITLIEASIKNVLKVINRSSMKHEVLFVLSAGDFKKDLNHSFFKKTYQKLSDSENVVIIGSFNQTLLPDYKLVSGSNSGYGIINGYAPGNGLYSWEPIQTRRLFRPLPKRERMAVISGSCGSAATVAGHAHRLFEDNPDFSSADVKEKIMLLYNGYGYYD